MATSVAGKVIRWLLAGAGTIGAVVGVLLFLGVIPLPSARTANGTAQKSATKKAEPDPIAVTVTKVTARPVQRKVLIVGTLAGFTELTITPKIEGVVTKILHDVGDVVKPGEPLLEIEEVYYRLAINEAQRALELELARIGLKELPPAELDLDKIPNIVKTKKDVAVATLRANRAKELQPMVAISQEEYDKAMNDYQVSLASRDHAILEAKATLAAARQKQAILDTAKQKFEETTVRAPIPSPDRVHAAINGLPPGFPIGSWKGNIEYVVAQRLVAEGEMVRAFPSVAVFRLVIDRPLKLITMVPERHMGEIKVGQAAEIYSEAYPKEIFKGTVARVSPTVDRTSRTFYVEVLIPNEDRRLKPGSFAKLAISTMLDPSAPTVPEEAVVTFAGVNKVFTVKDGKAQAVTIQLGMPMEVPTKGRKETWLEVSGDLSPSDVIVTAGHSKLVEGSPVRIRTPGSQP